MCFKIGVKKGRRKMAVCRLSLKLAWQTDWHTKTIFFSIFRSIFSQLQYFEINIFFHWAQALTSRWQVSAGSQDIDASVHRFLFVWPFMSGVPRIGSRKSWGIIIDKCFPQISAVLVNIPPPIWETVKVWLGEDLKLKIPPPTSGRDMEWDKKNVSRWIFFLKFTYDDV